MLSIPAAASAGEFVTFVSCDPTAEEPVASHVCEVGDSLGAFIESKATEKKAYELCVESPTEQLYCRGPRIVDPGVLYLDAVATDQQGYSAAYWFVGPDLVGSFVFKMNPRQVHPPDPFVVPPAVVAPPPPPVEEPSQSKGCLKAQGQVTKLKGRLGNATERRPKAKIRTALKAAKASVKRACA